MSKRLAVETLHDGSAQFKVGDDILDQDNTRVFALIEHVASGISDAVLRDRTGRFVRIISVLGGKINGRAEQEGWYVADPISEVDANLLRQSWTVLVRQPDAPDAIKGD